MKQIYRLLGKNSLWVGAFLLSFVVPFLSSCSDKDDEPERSQDDIIGIWTDGRGRYMKLDDRFRSFNLYIEEQDGETIGEWEQDGYVYEPGYDIVIYMDKNSSPDVYKIVELTDDRLVWCWVDNIRGNYQDSHSIGEIIGDIIKEAHEGYHLNPALYEYFTKVSEDEYLEILDELDMMEPW